MSIRKGKTSESAIPLLVIVGPTASGKSALAVRLARRLGGEIVSADSRQVYKSLDIGTGKITRREMRGVPHHLLDVANPRIPTNSPRHFSVEKWRTAAESVIADIHDRGRLPIICGGTGFYISALVDGMTFPDVPPNKGLRERLSKKSATELFGMLKKLDPRRAGEMKNGPNRKINGDWQNSRRLIRAIEIATALGNVPPQSTASSVNVEKRALSKYSPVFIGIDLPPEILQKRIGKRLKDRLDQGMIDEVKNLHLPPPRGIGLSWKRIDELGLEYRFIARYLRGPQTPACRKEMLAKLETEIRRYAKRQMTWWKRNKRIVWLTPEKAGVFTEKLFRE